MEAEGVWLPIVDYCRYREISISTVRRYIKGGQVKHKKEKGKYLVFVNGDNYQKKQQREGREIQNLKRQLGELRTCVNRLEEENNDLKMLVKIYEGRKH